MSRAFVFAVLLFASVACRASPEVEALSRCIADSTTGKDRKDLARWLFTAMSSHPDMRSISAVSPEAIDEAAIVAGGLFTRLLADSCPKEVRAAMRVGGSRAIQTGFQTLGQLAMQELVADKDVAASMAVLERYLDRNKLEALGR